MTYRTRYAPTPSGAMHLGHARTALVAWLRARTQGGCVVMRIEDLDPPRVREGSEASILRDHAWLGLDWDEGPIRQRDRFERYAEALEPLRAKERVYPCTCTRKEVQEAAAQAPHGDEPIYPGTCRLHPSHPERDPAWRFSIGDAPDTLGPSFVDVLQGAQPGAAGDPILRRSDGLFAYPLAVVVDDHDMGITEVVRGDDLLSATSKQLALYDAFGWSRPAFLHVPLVLGADGVRLAKRHGAVGIADYRDAGWTKERILGLLAHGLGLLPEATQVSLDELRDRFVLSQLQVAPSVLAGPDET
ncbi:MAG: tRNA glutamyl-Q(34) synthetase GluQRS [Sandaracinus sp.]|nr:tRNA glutamyl-Q(34) synthetase GluQRS [Sandaracinus sp.]